MDVTIARLANLYGPGQDLGKLQGLISRLALAAITKQTLTMFVPLDTLRDFIQVDDAAQLSLDWLTNPSSACQVRVIATGHSTSLGFIINQMKDITHTQIPVAYGMHPSAGDQARDLRLIPDTLDCAQPVPVTPLPAGMKAVFDDILCRHQKASSLTE
jgi:UDP-glucose 4-epimerase